MTKYFSIDCNYTCWKCPRDCKMKTMMTKLPEPIFNQTILSSFESNAGMGMTMLGWNAEQAHDFVVQHTVAISIARKKYLETLKNR